MLNQYSLLLKEFYEGSTTTQFNYTDETYVIPENLLNNLSSWILASPYHNGTAIDPCIVLQAPVTEVQGIQIVSSETSENYTTVGDSRRGESLVVGVEPGTTLNDWFLDGGLLNETWQVVVGDTLSKELFSDPLEENLRVLDRSLNVVGVCFDPINNGRVAYVSFQALQNASGMSGPNVVLLKTDPSVNQTEFLNQVTAVVNAVNPEFKVLGLNDVLDKCLGFVNYMWSTVMVLPLFSLIASSFCLVGYVMLTVDEQRQEFGVLRAVGAKPSMVSNVVSGQSLIVLLSSYAVGVAFGIIATLLILVQGPLVTVYNVLEISGLLTVALLATFVPSLYPALRFARKPLLEMMRQT
jgi:ABC-type antimicrobial peptide transport system permease subunit